MKYRIGMFSEIFIAVSLLYLALFEFDISFTYLILYISTLVFANEIVRIGLSSFFLLYRSKNFYNSFVLCANNIISKIFLPYLIFSIFVMFNCYSNINIDEIVLVFINLISILLLITYIVTYLTINFCSSKQIIITLLILISQNYFVLFIFGPDLVMLTSIFSLFDFNNKYLVVIKFIIIACIIIVTFFKSKREIKYETK